MGEATVGGTVGRRVGGCHGGSFAVLLAAPAGARAVLRSKLSADARGAPQVEAKDLKVAVSTNVALGGQACAVVFKKS